MSAAWGGTRAPWRTAAAAAGLTLAVLAQPLASGPAAAAAKPPVPASIALPADIEPLPSYQAPVACDPVAKSGPKDLEALLKKTYGKTSFGITRACSGTPTSEHQEGRALDWMMGGSTTKADANAFLAWLLATDKQHYTVAMARRMGIMYIVWQNKIFRIYHPDIGWQPYLDCATRPSKSDDTYCHRNHVHYSFTWDGAMARTSYWSGSAVTVPDCDKPSREPASASPSAKGLEYVPLPDTPVLDTSTGLGTPSGDPCRLAQSGYSGEDRRLDVKVAGVSGVPADARAVVLQVRAASPNAKGSLQIAPTGASSWAFDALTPTAGTSEPGLVTVPVGSGGAVTLTLGTGQAYVRIDVLGYLAPAGAVGGTRLHVERPKVALDTAGSAPLASAAEVGLTRADLGVPASATAVSLGLVVTDGSTGGGVRVYGADDALPPSLGTSPYASTGRTAASSTVVRLGAGTGTTPVVLVRNGSGTRNVQVVATGYYAPAAVSGGSVYRTLKPVTSLDTATHVGLTSPLLAGVRRNVTLGGRLGVPAGASALVGQVRVAATARTEIALWSSGSTPNARLLAGEAGRTTTTALLAQLSSTGRTILVSDAGSARLRMVVVGAWLPLM
jgi:hypothetical protein